MKPFQSSAGRLPVLVMSAVVALTALGLAGCGAPAPTHLEVGAVLPEFALPSLDGTKASSADLIATDGLTLINFWATWCGPCRSELPELVALDASPTLAVVGIALDDKGAETVAPFVAEHGLPYPILLGHQKIFQRLGGIAIPYTLIVDPSGRVLKIYRGPVSRARLARDLGDRPELQGLVPAAPASDEGHTVEVNDRIPG